MKIGIIAGLLALLAAAPAAAEVTATALATTDYMSRGTSQTYGRDAVIGIVDYQSEQGWYATGFVANVYFKDGTDVETDVFLGRRQTIGGWNTDVGLGIILYQGTRESAFNPTGKWDMVEATVSANRAFDRLTVGGKVGVTPDYFNIFGPGLWIEGNTSYAVHEKFSVGTGAGRQFLEDGFSYSTYNVGATAYPGNGWSVDLRWHDTDRHDIDTIYEGRLVLTLGKTF